jgi:hypothetical protein
MVPVAEDQGREEKTHGRGTFYKIESSLASTRVAVWCPK